MSHRATSVSDHEPGPDVATAPAGLEPPRERLARHAHRARLYTTAVVFVVVLVILVGLTAANLRAVKLDWIVGSTRVSLVWVIVATTVLGWVLGMATSIIFRHRTRRPRRSGSNPGTVR